MKKIFLVFTLALFVMLAISCDVETNYTEDGHHGKVVVHNDTEEDMLMHIVITGNSYFDKETHYSGNYLIKSGSSAQYELSINVGFYGIIYNSYTVTITDISYQLEEDADDLQNTPKSINVSVYEDIVRNLYFNGTDLVEKK